MRDIERELEILIDKHKGKQVGLGEIRLDWFAEDCLKEIRRLQAIARQSETEMITCPNCGGSGVYQEYDENDRYHVHACGKCEGTGAIACQSVTSEEWVSVDDRLPEDNIPVLVTYLGCADQEPFPDDIAKWSIEANSYNGGWLWRDDDSEVKLKITHWKPLPPSPKGYEPTTRKDRIVEEVQEAIEYLQPLIEYLQPLTGHSVMSENFVKHLKTVITALQAYQPTTRKDRTVEEVQRAIEYYVFNLADRLHDGKDEVTKRFETVITALQAYEPTVRSFRIVEEEVEAIEQYQPWVNAEVEKPKVGKPVLVTYIGHNDGKPYSDGVATWQFEEDGHKGGWFWEIDGCKVAVEITHWKPLPEPAKGE